MTIELVNGDCLNVYPTIERDSIDLILCDPPYGTIKNIKWKGYQNQNTSWDIAIEPKNIFDLANHCLRKNGKIILFSQEPYTSHMIQSSFENIDFCYRMVWKKDHFANCLLSKKAPVSYYEDILVYKRRSIKYDFDNQNPLRSYFQKVLVHINKSKSQINTILSHTKADHCFRIKSTQFKLCTKEVYQELKTVFNIDKMNGFQNWIDLKKINEQQKKLISQKLDQLYPSIFNLPKGSKYKSNILEYSKDYGGLHPTQKPVKLLEDLIKTYSNEGDKVLDFTMGSGSTGIGCLNLNRDFIGIEKDLKYFEIAKERLETHQQQLRLFT
jgi:DNA modification methylase